MTGMVWLPCHVFCLKTIKSQGSVSDDATQQALLLLGAFDTSGASGCCILVLA